MAFVRRLNVVPQVLVCHAQPLVLCLIHQTEPLQTVAAAFYHQGGRHSIRVLLHARLHVRPSAARRVTSPFGQLPQHRVKRYLQQGRVRLHQLRPPQTGLASHAHGAVLCHYAGFLPAFLRQGLH